MIYDSQSRYLREYESRRYDDEGFRITFHTDRVFQPGFETHSESNIKNNMEVESSAHWHEAIEVLRIKSGSGYIFLGAENLKIESGDIVVVNANELHRIRTNEKACVYDCLSIDYKSCLDWGIDLYSYTYKPLFKSSVIDSMFDKMSREYLDRKSHFKVMVTGFCMEIMAVLTRDYISKGRTQDASSQKKIELVRKIMRYISKHYDSQQILDDISGTLQYSKFYLAHIFMELTGLSIKEYQMQTRFSAAKKLLREKTFSIGEIAAECGYHNSASFTAAFQKRFSETPSQYRQRKVL